MLIDANDQVTSSIREHDAQTADYLEFLGHKMRQDLAKQIESRIDPIRLKMFNDSSKMISAKYKFMVKRARRNIARRYRNSVNNSIAHMNYKILKAGGKKVEIRRDSDGYMVCTPFRPPTPMSPPPPTRIDTEHDPQQQTDSTPLPDSTSSDDADSSEAMVLSNSKEHARSSATIDVPPSNPKVPVTKKRRTLPPNRCEPRQCEQYERIPSLDFIDNPRQSYTKMHHYLCVCNCQICIKKLFEQKKTSRIAPKCQCKCLCRTCQPYWLYDAEHSVN